MQDRQANNTAPSILLWCHDIFLLWLLLSYYKIMLTLIVNTAADPPNPSFLFFSVWDNACEVYVTALNVDEQWHAVRVAADWGSTEQLSQRSCILPTILTEDVHSCQVYLPGLLLRCIIWVYVWVCKELIHTFIKDVTHNLYVQDSTLGTIIH